MSAAEPKNVEAVLSFLSFFEQGANTDFHRTLEGQLIDPFEYSDKVLEFEQVLYREGFILLGFDWGEWMNNGGDVYLKDKEKIKSADIFAIQRLFTAIIRGDRFTSGLIAEM